MLNLSIKYLFSRKSQTILTLLGIIIGSFAFVTINSFFQGFQGFLMENLVNNNAHIKITPRDSTPSLADMQKRVYSDNVSAFFINNPKQQKVNEYIQSPELWYRRFRLDKEVVAFSPQITSNAMVTQIAAPYSVKLVGIDPSAQMKITDIENKMVNGSMSNLSKKNSFVIGAGLAKKIGAYLSDLVYLSIGEKPPTAFKVRGIFATGIRDFDENTIYSNIEDAWEIIGDRGKINTIGVRLKDFQKSALKVSHWAEISDERIESWDQINKNFLNVFKIQNVTRYMMVFITIIVASFGIFNVLNMMVNNKKRDIAILGALGFTPKQVSQIFLNQGLLLGLVGGIIGLILGYFGCLFIETIPMGETPMGTGTGHLNVAFEISIYLKAFFIAIFAAVFSSYFPARSASKLQPIDIIRGQASDA